MRVEFSKVEEYFGVATVVIQLGGTRYGTMTRGDDGWWSTLDLQSSLPGKDGMVLGRTLRAAKARVRAELAGTQAGRDRFRMGQV